MAFNSPAFKSNRKRFGATAAAAAAAAAAVDLDLQFKANETNLCAVETTGCSQRG